MRMRRMGTLKAQKPLRLPSQPFFLKPRGEISAPVEGSPRSTPEFIVCFSFENKHSFQRSNHGINLSGARI